MANLFDLCLDSKLQSTRTALKEPGQPPMTYAELCQGSARLANVLTAAGLVPGDRVAVQVEKSARCLLLYLACLRAGLVYLPLNTAYTLVELAYFVGDAEPGMIVCDPSVVEGVQSIAAGVGARVETLDEAGRGSLADLADAASPEFATIPRTDDDLAAIVYTSGTTGRSKGAMLTLSLIHI